MKDEGQLGDFECFLGRMRRKQMVTLLAFYSHDGIGSKAKTYMRTLVANQKCSCALYTTELVTISQSFNDIALGTHVRLVWAG